MKRAILRLTAEEFGRSSINLGRADENIAVRVEIDLSRILAQEPTAKAHITVESPSGTKYPAVTSMDGTKLIWDVTKADNTVEGTGYAQLTVKGPNGEVLKSAVAATRIGHSIRGEGLAPDPVQNWVDDAANKLSSVAQAGEEAEKAASSANAAAEAANAAAKKAEDAATGNAFTAATDEDISGRLNNKKAIVCTNMDYAVKAAMCDGKGAAWTKTEQKKARERIGAVGLDNGSSTSANLYDPSIQTAETIAPHYYVNGVPYTTTQYDTMWNCTAPISVSPNTTYTLGIVPAYHYVYADEDIMIVKPWSHAGSGVQFYDESGTWIRSTSLNTFTTPENCASIRFNYIKGKKIDLAMLAERCMLVKGDTLPTTYEAYGTNDTTGIASVLEKNGLPHYEYRNDVLTVYQNGTKTVYGYSGNNNIMMCKGYGLEDAFIPFTTDILSPMIITASENADGDLDDSYRLTGGNHSYGQTSGTPSANTVLVEVFADGKPAKTTGLFNTLILHARHKIQAWNTEKADGTGRPVIIEDDYIIWDGKRMNVEIHLTPTEKVIISEYYGLQLAEINSCNVYGDKIRKNIATGGYSDEIPYYIEGICGKFKIRMHIDDVGLGKYTYNASAIKYSKNNYKKAYFRPIGESHAFTDEDCLWLRGYFEIDALEEATS